MIHVLKKCHMQIIFGMVYVFMIYMDQKRAHLHQFRRICNRRGLYLFNWTRQAGDGALLENLRKLPFRNCTIRQLVSFCSVDHSRPSIGAKRGNALVFWAKVQRNPIPSGNVFNDWQVIIWEERYYDYEKNCQKQAETMLPALIWNEAVEWKLSRWCHFDIGHSASCVSGGRMIDWVIVWKYSPTKLGKYLACFCQPAIL